MVPCIKIEIQTFYEIVNRCLSYIWLRRFFVRFSLWERLSLRGGQALPHGLEAGLEAAARRLIYGSFVRCWEAAPTSQPPVWCTEPFLTPQRVIKQALE